MADESSESSHLCAACGLCCDLYGHTLRAAEADLARWRKEAREDLVSQVGVGGVLWIEPRSGVHLDFCPHLVRIGTDRARCSIHPTKPTVCRGYPTAAHGGRCVRRGAARGSV